MTRTVTGPKDAVAIAACAFAALGVGLLFGTRPGLEWLPFLGAVVLFLVLVWDIRLIVPILVVSLPFGPKFAMGFGNLYLSTVILIIAYLAFAVRAPIVREGLCLRYSGVVLGVVGLMGVFVLSALQNYQVLLSDRTAFLKFIQFLLYTGIFVLACQMNFSRREIRAILIFAVVVGVGQGLVGAMQWIARPGLYVAGTFDNEHNLFASYVAFIMILVVGIMLEAKRAAVRLACVASISVMLYAIAFSFSRTAYVSILVSCLAFAAMPIGRIKRLLVPAGSIGIAAVALFLLPVSVLERARNIMETATGQLVALSFKYRLKMWRLAVEDMAESPILGKGAWAYELRDNFFVKVAAEAGILGFVVFLAMVYIILRASWLHAAAPPRDDFMRGVVVAFFPAAVGSLIVFNLAGDFLSLHRFMGVFWIVLALMLQYCSADESGTDGTKETVEGPLH